MKVGGLRAFLTPGAGHFQRLEAEVCPQVDKPASGGLSKCMFGEVGR